MDNYILFFVFIIALVIYAGNSYFETNELIGIVILIMVSGVLLHKEMTKKVKKKCGKSCCKGKCDGKNCKSCSCCGSKENMVNGGGCGCGSMETFTSNGYSPEQILDKTYQMTHTDVQAGNPAMTNYNERNLNVADMDDDEFEDYLQRPDENTGSDKITARMMHMSNRAKQNMINYSARDKLATGNYLLNELDQAENRIWWETENTLSDR